MAGDGFVVHFVEPAGGRVDDEIGPAAQTSGGSARDAKDSPVLGTLLAAQADYLITGDKDLLALKDRYVIVSPAEFWNRHGA